MVDRNNPKSRKRVFKMAKKRLQNGVSMAIFPEGLVPTEDVVLSPFKKGAFSLALEYQIPIVPQVYYDCKRLFSWDMLKGGPGILRVHQHNFIPTNKLIKDDLEALKNKTYRIMYNDLISDAKYIKDTNKTR
jgi:1-acyl-sn-glycerol-3-phosphate acyltransferase